MKVVDCKMKLVKDCVLFNNYIGGYDFDEVKKEYAERNEVPIEKISDNMVLDLISEYEREDWETVMSELESPYCILCVGSFGKWYGTFPGGRLFYGESIENIIGEVGKDCAYFKIYTDEKGNLNVTCSHHDGSNSVEFYAVNGKGQRYIDKHDRDMEDWELHEHLINSNMTRQIKVYERW